MTNRIKSKLVKVLVLLSLALSVVVQASYDTTSVTRTIDIAVGQWGTNDPQTHIPGYDLNEWVNNKDLNHNIPKGQIFSYEGKLYVSLDNTYNPQFHGLPGKNKLHWAYINPDKEWVAGYNYMTHQVVTYLGKTYISVAENNWNTWDITTWSWQEIEPIEDIYFPTHSGTTIIDYTKPDMSKVIYK